MGQQDGYGKDESLTILQPGSADTNPHLYDKSGGILKYRYINRIWVVFNFLRYHR